MTKTAVQQKHVTVGIVGGGIAGLTLANYLEQAGIPYLLWEKGAEIVPAVGASVGMMPNGLRVLDQLGIIDELEKYRIEHDRWEHRDGDDGTLYTATTAMRSHANEIGYCGFVLERKNLIKILFDNINDKSPIHTNKTVVSVQSLEDKAIITARDGSCFSCDLVAGADGVYSVIRQEINSIKPVTHDPKYLDTKFSCVYGVSDPVPGVKQGVWYSIYRQNVSALILTGVGGSLHWFVFEDLEGSVPFGHTPRYNQEDLNRVCGKLEHTMVTPGVTFGRIFAQKTITAMTPLEEGVVTNWYAGRMVLIGDSGHKMVPHAAMGANLAIESVACFANILTELRKELNGDLPAMNIPSTKIDKVLQKYSENRTTRAGIAMGIAQFSCRAQVKIDQEAKKYVSNLPNIGRDKWLWGALSSYSYAEKINQWDGGSERVSYYSEKAQKIQALLKATATIKKVASTG